MDVSAIVTWVGQGVAEDAHRERMFTVPQEPWPDDGTYPIAAHYIGHRDPETGEEYIKWTGSAYGAAATCVTRGLIGALRVRAEVFLDNGMPAAHLRLVDDRGCVRAQFVQQLWWS